MGKTLTALSTLLGLEYERNQANLDAPTAARTAALNRAQREMALLLGDQCWYLQRAESVAWTAASGAAMALDAAIQRILYLENTVYAGQEIPYRGNGVNSDGKLEIIIDTAVSSPVRVHYLIAPTELAIGSDETKTPDLYVDALILGACKYLAVGGGSAALLQSWTLQFNEAMRFVSRDCMRRHRQREETQHVVLDTSGWNDGSPELGPWSWTY